jgi:DNA-binding MarR family transcriptional regulator
VGQGANTLAEGVIHKFLLVNRYLRQYARQMTKQGMRPWELAVLRFLSESGPATVGQVQGYLYRSAGTTSMIITQLEEAGYVTRTRSAQDNRVVIVDLTATGRQLAQETPMGGIALLRHRLGGLSEARLHRLDDALADIMQLMEVTEIEE